MKRLLFIMAALLGLVMMGLGVVTMIFLVELEMRGRGERDALRRTPHPWLMLRPYGIWSFPGGAEGSNEQGFRFSGDIPVIPAPGELRIALLGGSVVWGHGVGAGETISAVLESELRSRRSTPVTVLNFGIPGYMSSNELVLLALRVICFHPDLVVVIDGWNDMCSEGYIRHYNYFIEIYRAVLNQYNHGFSTIDTAARTVFTGTISGRVLQRIHELLSSGAAPVPYGAAARAAVERDMGSAVHTGEAAAVGAYYDNLVSMAGLARAHGSAPLFILQPYNTGSAPTQAQAVRYPAYEQQLAAACRTAGATGYSAMTLFKNCRAEHDMFLDKVHLSVAGNRFMGMMLAELVPEVLNAPDAQPPQRLRIETCGDASDWSSVTLVKEPLH
ncbi:SGNH/GDSL hydrolase family protein [bacterium]|nr:SGNH/GDSL hydrolase family protein [candidate division CSSED10-310 bacterium]